MDTIGTVTLWTLAVLGGLALLGLIMATFAPEEEEDDGDGN